MGAADTGYVRMREDELVARIRYHEDRRQQAERLAAFHRAAGEAARNDLTALHRPAGPQALLVAPWHSGSRGLRLRRFPAMAGAR